MPPPNYGGQQPMMPGQHPMPNMNQGKSLITQTKLLSFNSTHRCLVACVDLTE